MPPRHRNGAADLAIQFGDRLTKIETIMEMRMKQGDEFLKDWGAFKQKLDVMNVELLGLRGFVQDVEAVKHDVSGLKKHREDMERLKARATGIAFGVGIPTAGGSGIVWVEKLMKFFGSGT